MARVFEARFTGGYCVECGYDIVKGDEITKAADGNIRHAECDVNADYDSYFGFKEK